MRTPMGYGQHLIVRARPDVQVALVQPHGVLDSTTYRQVRNAIITAAIEAPTGVVVDVTSLAAPEATAWAALTSAQWHISRWPGVPMALVCATSKDRETLIRCGVARYIPVHTSTVEAFAALGRRPPVLRQRERARLARKASNPREARELVARWLTAWGRPGFVSIAKLAVTALVENVLAHTESAPTIWLESRGDAVAVATEDSSSVPASRRERPTGGTTEVSGLAVVSALCRSWGNAPTSSGKAVWAVVGPENWL